MLLILIFVSTLGLSLLAAARVRSVYHKHNQEPVLSGLTGREAAEYILRRAGIHDVTIDADDGMLSDHYDPIRKRLVLSAANYEGRTAAALGVAAHECGHAIQHQHAYQPLMWRVAAVGAATYANHIVLWLPLIGLFTGLIQPLTAAWILATAWGVLALFNLVTLPVEFDATRRAKAVLAELHMIQPGREAAAVSQVLNAAAWTYVAAFVTSLAYLFWHLIPLLTGRSDE
jgi:Zn-dependent membrane protease YugP